MADAERAFAAQAQREGQWKAFLAWADPEAVMFAPEMVKARDFLAKLPEPRVKVMWWPALTVTSCDGRLAVSTGPWTIGGKAHGTFTTIWRYGPDGWKWLYDSGRDTPEAVPAGALVEARRAHCPAQGETSVPIGYGNGPGTAGHIAAPHLAAPDLIVQFDDRMPIRPAPDIASIHQANAINWARAKDGTLFYQVVTLEGGAKGAHMLRVWRWNGTVDELALADVTGTTAP